MNKTLRKCISSMVALSTMGATLGVAAVTHAAGQLTAVSNNLSTSASLTVSNHTLGFSNASTIPFKAVTFFYCTTPSGTCVRPSGLTTTSVALGSSTGGTGTWTNVTATNGSILLTNSAGTGTLATNVPFTFSLTNITNNDATIVGAGACDAILNSESCYVRVSTYTSDTLQDGTTLVDTGSTSYTVLTQILVTATVDPVLTFSIGSVVGTAINTNDTNAGCGVSNVDTTATTVPFGNLGVGIANAKCAQQSLTVITNAQNGYSVYNKFYNSTQTSKLMYGTNVLNKLDPYEPAGTTYIAPSAFSLTPNGTTPNTDTGWLGIRTKNAGSGGPFSTSNFYGTPYIGLGAGNTVMTQLTPDSGTVPTYVTFKVAVSAYQPADSYTGSMFYTVVPSY